MSILFETTVQCQGCENECEVSVAVVDGKSVCLGGNNCPTGESFALAQINGDAMEEIKIDGMTFKASRIDLPGSAILVINGAKAILGCGYIAVETADKLGHALAIVTGVKTHEDMLVATVKKVSAAAAALGVQPGMTGREALLFMEKKAV